MRIGKFVEHFKTAAELYDASGKVRANGGDQVLQYLAVMRQLGYAFYMSFDMLTVMDAAGIKKSAAAKRRRESIVATSVRMQSGRRSALWLVEKDRVGRFKLKNFDGFVVF
jgi:hypothetical protein